MAYVLKNPAGVDLLDAVESKAGSKPEPMWLDLTLAEAMAYMLAGPARCKAATWTTWDALPAEVQSILLGVLARKVLQGETNVVGETIGDYSVKYSDPALFEGKLPRFLHDHEELAMAKLAGCGGGLKTVNIGITDVIDQSSPEEDYRPENWVYQEPSHANGFTARKVPRR
jgi:hypothetical protein